MGSCCYLHGGKGVRMTTMVILGIAIPAILAFIVKSVSWMKDNAVETPSMLDDALLDDTLYDNSEDPVTDPLYQACACNVLYDNQLEDFLNDLH